MPETLTDHKLQQFCALISSFAHIFATKSDDLGRTSLLKCKIETYSPTSVTLWNQVYSS